MSHERRGDKRAAEDAAPAANPAPGFTFIDQPALQGMIALFTLLPPTKLTPQQRRRAYRHVRNGALRRAKRRNRLAPHRDAQRVGSASEDHRVVRLIGHRIALAFQHLLFEQARPLRVVNAQPHILRRRKHHGAATHSLRS